MLAHVCSWYFLLVDPSRRPAVGLIARGIEVPSSMQRVWCSTNKGIGEDLGQSFALPLHVAIPQQWHPTYPSEYKEVRSGTVRVPVISVHHSTTRVHAYIQPDVHIYGCWSLTSSDPLEKV